MQSFGLLLNSNTFELTAFFPLPPVFIEISAALYCLKSIVLLSIECSPKRYLLLPFGGDVTFFFASYGEEYSLKFLIEKWCPPSTIATCELVELP